MPGLAGPDLAGRSSQSPLLQSWPTLTFGTVSPPFPGPHVHFGSCLPRLHSLSIKTSPSPFPLPLSPDLCQVGCLFQLQTRPLTCLVPSAGNKNIDVTKSLPS